MAGDNKLLNSGTNQGFPPDGRWSRHASGRPGQPMVTLNRQTPVQEFAKDEVLVTPSLDPYLEIVRANQVLSSGKSLALDAEERFRRSFRNR